MPMNYRHVTSFRVKVLSVRVNRHIQVKILQKVSLSDSNRKVFTVKVPVGIKHVHLKIHEQLLVRSP